MHVNTLNKSTIISAFFGLSLMTNSSALADEWFHWNPEAEIEVFTALSIGGGISETNRVDGNFERTNNYDDFGFFSLEAQVNWNGFFLDLPGRSQEKVEGQFAGNGIGYNFYNSENWALDLYYFQASNNALFTFTNTSGRIELDRVSDVRLAIRATGYYRDYLTQFIVAPLSSRDEIKGFDASASVRRNFQLRNWNLYASLGIRYQSSEIHNYYYGISEDESARLKAFTNVDIDFPERNLLAPYDASSGTTVVGEIGFEYPITEDWVAGGFYVFQRLPDSVVDSPIQVDDNYVSAVGLSLTYVF